VTVLTVDRAGFEQLRGWEASRMPRLQDAWQYQARFAVFCQEASLEQGSRVRLANGFGFWGLGFRV
jgi:hypothetical protein